MTYSITIPCYNEENNIPLLVERFASVMQGDNIGLILVDNGSQDKTGKVIDNLLAEHAFLSKVTVPVNKGYGNGILQGLAHAKSDYLGWTHADMQTDPNDIVKACMLIEENGMDNLFVKGNRKGRPLFDQFFTTGMSFFESVYLGKKLTDINAQPNIFPIAFYNSWKNPPLDFSLDLYALYMAYEKGLDIKRFDVVFPPRIHGESSWNTGMASKWKFIKRTVDFSANLKKKGIS